MPLLPLDDARAHVLERVVPLGATTVPLVEGLGRVTAEAIVASEAVPPFANSAMDGFAVRSADLTSASGSRPVELRVVHTQAAGAPPSISVERGQAIRIMTGAVVPSGADAVVMVERSHALADDLVGFVAPAPLGDNIREPGSDIAAGVVVVETGTLLRPTHVGVMASAGRATVSVIRRPRVGVLSTGDELVPAGQPLAAGQIRDSNRPALLATVAAIGCEPVDLGSALDDEAAIEQALRLAVESCDAVVTSGGVSVGDFDWVKVVLDRMGDMRWMQIAIRPAKPFAFGVVASADGRTVPVFGLPGNPVSSLVSFELLARPALRRMAGISPVLPPPATATLAHAVERRPDGKVHFLRVATGWVDGQLVARSVGGQGSHQLGAMAGADALAVVPDGPGLVSGATVEILGLP
jgi:molybdopterin molybdotransferase